jgi:hypothetical protein
MAQATAPLFDSTDAVEKGLALIGELLMVGYCYGIRFERRLCEEVELAG